MSPARPGAHPRRDPASSDTVSSGTAPPGNRAIALLVSLVLCAAVVLVGARPDAALREVAAPVEAPASGGGEIALGVTPVQDEEVADEPGRVLIVTFPRVTWERVRDVDPPVLTGFLERAAVASSSPRTVGPRTQPAQAYLTIGAGNRASALAATTAGLAAGVGQQTTIGPAAEVFERRSGAQPDGAIVNLNFPAQVSWNDRLLYGTVPGSLGQALREAGIGMAAIGNAATFLEDEDNRDVALGAADRSGQVTAGQVDSGLLEVDQTRHFGLRADHGAHVAALEAAWDSSGVALVELSDLERAERGRAESTAEQGERMFDEALLSADELFGALLETVDLQRDLVIAVAPTAPLAAEQLGLFAMAGPGVDPGWATSPTTRRAGYVTLTDIAPTVLSWFDLDVPGAMHATPVTSAADGSVEQRTAAMERDNDRARFRDRATGPLTVAFIVLLVAMLAVVSWVVARNWTRPAGIRTATLLVLSVPAVMYLGGLLPYDPFTTTSFGLALLGIALVLAVLAAQLHRIDPVLPPLALAGLCLATLLADIATGGHLQINTVFGYSPIVAGRFAGFGNQAFALVGICALVVATAGWELSLRRWPSLSSSARLAPVLVLFAVVVVMVGAPSMGSDVGGVLAAVPAFAVCALLLLGRRISPALAAGIAAAAVGVLGAFALVDLSRPAESRTHLGRFVERVIDGEAAVILQRKLDTNLNILTSTVWTWTIPAALAFFAYLTWRPNRMMKSIERDHRGFRPFLGSTLVLGVVAFALNDSGVALPAMMLGIVLPYTSYLALGVLRRGSAGPELDAAEEADGADRRDAAHTGSWAEDVDGELPAGAVPGRGDAAT